MRAIRVCALMGLAVLLATVALADQPCSGRGPYAGPTGADGPGGPGGPPDPVIGAAVRILHDIDLAPEQNQQIHATIQGQMDGELGTLARSFMEARHALEVQIWDPAATPDAILSASDLVAERTRVLVEARHALAVEVMSFLTDEQRETFREMLAEGPTFPRGPHGLHHRGR